MERHFTLEYWMDDEWYVGKLKEVPCVFSQGETLDELETNIRDAYHLIVETEPAFRTPRHEEERNYGACGVKRRIFIKELVASGCYVKRHGKKHDVYSKLVLNTKIPLPLLSQEGREKGRSFHAP